MRATTPQAVRWTDPKTLDAVRPEVRRILESTPSFAKLPEEERRKIASSMVKVASYMANPEGLTARELSDDNILAEPQSDAVEQTKQSLSQSPGFAGGDFEAGALQAGTDQFGALVQKVDFPKFVSGLIEGVFQAIVDSSIQQMQAYGDLLANVAKTVDQFAQDNISENNARDWLVDTFPEDLGVSSSLDAGFAFEDGETPEPRPNLEVKGEDPEASLLKISKELLLDQPVTDISDPNEELKIVTAARLRMARMRQQLLASMVVLGINRIVVVDGEIQAKVVFDMRAKDAATRRYTASMYDRAKQTSRLGIKARYGAWYSPWKGSMSSERTSEHVATVQSSVDETSTSAAETKAKLSGQVRVNFKSDYFPMDKLANPQMLATIQGNAKPVDPEEEKLEKQIHADS